MCRFWSSAQDGASVECRCLRWWFTLRMRGEARACPALVLPGFKVLPREYGVGMTSGGASLRRHGLRFWQDPGQALPIPARHRARNLPRRTIRVRVFPHPNDEPASGAQECVRFCVPIAIGLNFLDPPGPVALRRRAMDRAAVPEASIDEYGHSGSSKHDVRSPAPHVGKGRMVYAKPKAGTMEHATQRTLGLSVRSALIDHSGSGLHVPGLRLFLGHESPPKVSRDSSPCADRDLKPRTYGTHRITNPHPFREVSSWH